jgi:hypothetical protein
MNGVERLKRLTRRVEALYAGQNPGMSRDVVDRMAKEIAGFGEVALMTTTGFALRLIKKGLVDEPCPSSQKECDDE